LNLHIASVIGAGEPEQWSQFRGPNGSGVSLEDKRLPVQFGPEKNVLWKATLPSGHSSPCLWKDRIFLTAFDKGERKLETICLDWRNGKILWRRTAPAKEIEKGHKVSSPAAPTPATDGERVYVYFGSHGLLCYDLDGKLRWEDKRDFPNAKFGTGTSPIVVGDLVITNDQDDGLPLRAVHRHTGKPVWKNQSIGIGHATPIVWRRGKDLEIIVPCKNRLTSFKLDGTENWHMSGLPNDAFTTPVLGEGLLFVTYTSPGGEVHDRVLETFDEALAKYDKNKDKELSHAELPKNLVFIDRGVAPGTPDGGGSLTLELVFKKFGKNTIDRKMWDSLRQPKENARSAIWALRPGEKGPVPTKNKVWQHTTGLPEVPSPLYYRGQLYLFRRGGIATCLDARSGDVLWKDRLSETGAYYASPVAGDGKIYLASESGILYVLAAGKALKILAQNDIGERIMATPAIVDGTLFVRTESALYAFRP
jgi:outer membrane protein assembly factor BamB